MSILLSIVLAIIFSALTSSVTASILMVLYTKKINECLDTATEKVKQINEGRQKNG